MVELCYVCVRMSILCVLNVNPYCTYHVASLVYFIHPPLSGYQNQTNAFVFMSTFIIQSGVNSGHNSGDFCVCECEYEHIVCTQCKSVPIPCGLVHITYCTILCIIYIVTWTKMMR